MTRILFVCVENAGRSQMAEAFFRKYAPKKFQTLSAGTHPTSEINPLVKVAMKEIGIDMNTHKPKIISSEMIENSIPVNMGCIDKEACPALFVDNVEVWEIQDPKGKSIEEIRKIRDQIEFKTKELIKKLENN